MREIGLAGDRAERGEFGRGEADEIKPFGTRIGHIIEHRGLGRGGKVAGSAQIPGRKRWMAGITHGFRLVRSAADVIVDFVEGQAAGFSANSATRARLEQLGVADTGMTERQFGRGRKAARPSLVALALSLAPTLALTGAVPVHAQQTETPAPAPTPAPSSGRPLDFRLPPANDGRTPGVQGPADNGLPPLAPGERPGPSPTPALRPAPPPVIATQPAPGNARTPAPPRSTPRGETPTPTATRPAPGSAAVPVPTVPLQEAPALPPLTTGASPDTSIIDSAPVAVPDAAPSASSRRDGGGTPIWAWLLAALAALGAGIWYWRRRAVPDGAVRDGPGETLPPEQPRPAARSIAPRAVPPSPPKPAPMPVPVPALAPALPTANAGPNAASPLVTRPAPERRALLAIALDIHAIRFTPDHVAIGFGLNILNQGTAEAVGVLVRIALNQGSAMPEAVLGRFFDGAGGSVLKDDLLLAVGAGEGLTTEVMLPRAGIEPLVIGGKPMLIPVMAFDVTYHWEGAGDEFGQVAGSFVLGREAVAGAGDKLAPLPIDRASYTVDRPGARATAIKRGQ